MNYIEKCKIIVEEKEVISKWVANYFKQDLFRSMTLEELYNLICGKKGVYPSDFLWIILSDQLATEGIIRNENDFRKVRVSFRTKLK